MKKNGNARACVVNSIVYRNRCQKVVLSLLTLAKSLQDQMKTFPTEAAGRECARVSRNKNRSRPIRRQRQRRNLTNNASTTDRVLRPRVRDIPVTGQSILLQAEAGNLNSGLGQQNQNRVTELRIFDTQIGAEPSACTSSNPQDGHCRNSNGLEFLERRFLCTMPGCNMRYKKNHHLQSHMLAHSGEKNWNCNKCPKSYTRQDNLKRHQRKVHMLN